MEISWLRLKGETCLESVDKLKSTIEKAGGSPMWLVMSTSFYKEFANEVRPHIDGIEPKEIAYSGMKIKVDETLPYPYLIT